MNIDRAIIEDLRRRGILEDGDIELSPLTGGVSSDIWCAKSGQSRIVLKRALATLRVKADWQVPVNRNSAEVAWLECVAKIAPDHVPSVLAHWPEHGMFAMTYMPAQSHPVWKDRLLLGDADVVFAAEVGALLGRIHASTANEPRIQAQVNDDSMFQALRLEPYFSYLSDKYPALHKPLSQLIRQTMATKNALVHGDVSPKNILCGPNGPIILDAECAWFGDPAFDLAFVLNHLLLKSIHLPLAALDTLASFASLRSAYIGYVDWERQDALEARAAALLPVLLLARIDGKSPVEYLTSEAVRDLVRGFAIPFIETPPPDLAALLHAWQLVTTARTEHLLRQRSLTCAQGAFGIREGVRPLRPRSDLKVGLLRAR